MYEKCIIIIMSDSIETFSRLRVTEDEHSLHVNAIDDFPMRARVIKDGGYYILSWDTAFTGSEALDLLLGHPNMESAGCTVYTSAWTIEGKAQEALAEITTRERKEIRGVSVENGIDEGRKFWSAPDTLIHNDTHASFAVTGITAARILSVEAFASQTIHEQHQAQTVKHIMDFSKVFDRIMQGLPRLDVDARS